MVSLLLRGRMGLGTLAVNQWVPLGRAESQADFSGISQDHMLAADMNISHYIQVGNIEYR